MYSTEVEGAGDAPVGTYAKRRVERHYSDPDPMTPATNRSHSSPERWVGWAEGEGKDRGRERIGGDCYWRQGCSRMDPIPAHDCTGDRIGWGRQVYLCVHGPADRWRSKGSTLADVAPGRQLSITVAAVITHP